MAKTIKCACCFLTALTVIGNTVQVTLRHNGQYHTSTFALSDLIAQAQKQDMVALLDKIGVPVLE